MRITTTTTIDFVGVAFFSYSIFLTMTTLKKILAGTLALGFILGGCEEIPPTITPCQTDRVVLVEEFTGIDCVNCPVGAEKLKSIAQQKPNKVIIVGIHAGYFAGEHNGFSLNCTDSELLEAQYLGPVTGYPSATVNRKVFEGESGIVTSLNKWAGHIGQELCERAMVDVNISSVLNETDRKLSVTVDILPKDFVTSVAAEDIALTILITENDIVGYQKTPTGIDMSYVHEHVLRDVLSVNYSGDVIYPKGSALSAEQKVVSDYALPADWDVDNCHIVAFAHYKSAADKSVIQAAEASLGE